MDAKAESRPPEDATAKARRILVVDDDEDFAESIAELLEARGYSVAVANDDRRARTAPNSPSKSAAGGSPFRFCTPRVIRPLP